MKKHIYLLLVLAATACKKDLNLKPFDKLSPENAFNTEADLQLYANSFYKILPDGNAIIRGDVMSDYMAGKDVNPYIRPGAYSSTSSTGWSWSDLRNINYFLEHYNQANIPTEARNHFAGIARFFRAMFYFEKVKRFGDVPWYSRTMSINDPDLYKGRDPRVSVMDSVLADLDFACANIRSKKDNTASQVTKWVALAFKSRVCLFEGTFRKYRPELSLPDAAKWLKASLSAADELISSGQYSLNTAGDATMNYRSLFINEMPNANEIILAYVCNKSLRVFNDANWFFTSATYGNRISLTKTFTDTYLNIDGSRFTDKPGFDYLPFNEEVKNRDLRLQQTIRMGKYSRDGQIAPPDFTYTYTGYQPLKFTLDAKATDGVAENYNSIPIIRYAEVLLNKAEAKAELEGTLQAADWNQTIKPLRARAGLKNTDLPLTADPYLRDNFYGNLNPVLLEIRRERSIELILEGFRFYDLIRWNLGLLLTKPYVGLYVPAMDVLMDLNEDGKPDVSFVKKTPATKVPGVYYFLIDDDQTRLSAGTSGNLIWLDNIERKWEDYKYVYPIPLNDLTLNPALLQNKGWE
ncbi:putative outer membrane starch-binding protein [Chitinophaga polysaccharea]|uniref:Putative outer membrane starch-binding protein n=1 Tax=Chitinophaga polysaccharea TaxID=1293035 RepID=A0A561PGN1_9BACT|nr:RagB/SusD family nutrient uptake outer membrane protein [Chitinophaga polysaccharea]TWF37287.1 putative outer membrane starch-binding protein [Chitinophaga polysaccharea]